MNQAGQWIRCVVNAGLTFLSLVLVTGCMHSRERRIAAVEKFGDAHLTYFKSEQPQRIYIEVDAVEGTQFSPTELTELQAVLRNWTQKSDEVVIEQSSLIPRSVARGHSAVSLARRHLDGPPKSTNDFPCAYIYILVYDNRINRNPLQSPRAAELWPARDSVSPRLAASENPHITDFPYPAMIYVDRSWLGGLLPRKYWQRILFHETGHVLGLVSRESRVENRHCATNWCLMHAHVSANIRSDILDWLKREKPKPYLCNACVAELRRNQTTATATSSRFEGPVLVRKMPSYDVLALPAFCGLFIGDSIDSQIPEFVAEFRKLKGERGPWFTAIAQDHSDRESLFQALEAAKLDIDPTVREAARELERKVRGNEGTTTGAAME